MQRRDFLTGAATGAVVAGATYLARTGPTPMAPGTLEAPGQAPVVAKGLHEWKLVTTWPKNSPGAGTAVNMPAGEIMPALQSGIIDAAEWVGPWVDLAMGFYKVAKYYYGPGFHEGSTASELLINEDKWRSLPADLQAVVRVACQEANMKLPAEYFARSAETLDTLVNEHGVIVRHFPEDLLTRAFQISAEVNAETASEGELNRRIYESWSSFRKLAMAYQQLSDYGFIHNRGKAQDA
ncbi:MAG: twin-arginine translocation signal domain-containing protein [Alphaproteobacteria bacterium]